MSLTPDPFPWLESPVHLEVPLKRLIAAIALALLMSSTVAAKGGASISAPDGLSFGDTFSVTYTEPANWSGYLYAYAACYQGDQRVWADYEELPADLFHLGPTPRWSGGAATCTVELVVFSLTGKRTSYASGAFEVGA